MSEEILKKIQQTRRRLDFVRFLRLFAYNLATSLVVACGMMAWSQLANLHWNPWLISGASVGAALAISAAWTLFTRKSKMEAALELDSVFDLKERVTTLLSLEPELLAAPAGIALQHDALARTKAIDVREKIPLRLPRFGWLPVLPAVGIILIAFFVGPSQWFRNVARGATKEIRQVVEKETKLLETKIADRKKELVNSGLSENLKELTGKIDDAMRDLQKDQKVDVKDAVLKLNDLSKSIDAQKEKLQSLEAVKKELGKLRQNQDGPGQKLQQALKNGDFQEAAKQLEQLAQKMKEGKMDEPEKKKLAKQLDDMQKQMKELAELAKRAEQIKKNLPPEEAKKALEKLAQEAKKLDKLKDLAEKLQECSKCAGNGQKSEQSKESSSGQPKDGSSPSDSMQKSMQEAMEALNSLAKDGQLEEMLNSMKDDLEQCQKQMCQGECECQGNCDKPGDKPSNVDWARNGNGPASGKREEAKDETRTFKTKTKTEFTKGPVFIVGQTEGKSVKGQSNLQLRESAAAAGRAADEAISQQKVPNDYKDHTRDYFDKLNKGNSKGK